MAVFIGWHGGQVAGAAVSGWRGRGAGVSKVTESPPARPGRPAAQYLSAEHVVAEMADHGTRRLQRLSVLQILVLAMLAGGFVTVGALFSVLLATGVGSPGAQRLVEGLGFSAGFFFVILSDAVLFTEANVRAPGDHSALPRLLGSAVDVAA